MVNYLFLEYFLLQLLHRKYNYFVAQISENVLNVKEFYFYFPEGL